MYSFASVILQVNVEIAYYLKYAHQRKHENGGIWPCSFLEERWVGVTTPSVL